MRVLHTSDWHLGRSLHRADLRDAQAVFLDALVATVRGERVDLVVVAGDVFDRAVPPVDAVSLCEEALVRLRDAGARVVVISGNHDSARRLGFGSRLVDAAGVHLRTRPGSAADPVLVADAHGPVAVYGVPYLDPAAATLAAGERVDHAGALRTALDAVRADLRGRGPVRSIVAAHGWVAGGCASGSERDLAVGGVGCVPAELFDGIDYVALGHLHGPQVLAEHLRYSGSPLPYSFAEAGQDKGSWLVELDAAGLRRVERVPAPTGRRLANLRGTLPDLLGSPAYAAHADDFVSATLTDPVRPEAAMDRLRSRFPHVLVLSWEPAEAADDGRDYRTRVRGRGDLDVALAFVAHVRREPASAGERALLRTAFEAVRAGDTEPAVDAAPAGDAAPVARSLPEAELLERRGPAEPFAARDVVPGPAAAAGVEGVA